MSLAYSHELIHLAAADLDSSGLLFILFVVQSFRLGAVMDVCVSVLQERFSEYLGH